MLKIIMVVASQFNEGVKIIYWTEKLCTGLMDGMEGGWSSCFLV